MELKFSTERESQKKVKTARPDPPRQEAPREDKAIAGLARTPQLSSLFQPSYDFNPSKRRVAPVVPKAPRLVKAMARPCKDFRNCRQKRWTPKTLIFRLN